METVLSDDWREAKATPRLMATLEYLFRLTRRPLEVDASVVDAAVAAGASPGALEQATLMAMLFAYMNRMVDAFGADATPAEAERLARVLNTVGGGAELISRARPWKRFAGEVPESFVAQLEEIRMGDGDSPASMRRTIEAYVAGRSGGRREPGAALAPPVQRLVDTLVADAHGVTDQHIDDLRAEWSEEAIYEFIFVASFAAGLGRLERAVELLGAR